MAAQQFGCLGIGEHVKRDRGRALGGHQAGELAAAGDDHQAAWAGRQQRALSGTPSPCAFSPCKPGWPGWTGSWRRQRESARLFLTTDGEKDKAQGNETIRWHPGEGWLELKLPAPLARLAYRPHGRYRLCCPVEFSYRGGEVAAQAASGAVRYDISQDPASGRWYLDASWKTAPAPAPSLEELRRHPVVAVDVNTGHLAVAVVAADGNALGTLASIGLALAGLPAATRDGRLRAAITSIIATARQHGARAIVIEDLDFAEARAEGRERAGSRPSRGRRGRAFRRLVAGIPTGKLRDRLVQMAAHADSATGPGAARQGTTPPRRRRHGQPPRDPGHPRQPRPHPGTRPPRETPGSHPAPRPGSLTGSWQATRQPRTVRGRRLARTIPC